MMKEFQSILKDIEEKLEIPQPARSRVILEIGIDMQDTYQFYLESGMAKSEALNKTKQQFAPTSETLQELQQVHQSLYKRILDKFSGQLTTKVEKVGMLLVILFIALASIKVIISNSFFLNASSLTLPVLGIGFLAIVLSINKAFTLYIKKDHNISRLHKGLPVILFLGGASLLTGVIGLFIETYQFFAEAAFEIENFLILFLNYLMRVSTMMIIGLFLMTIILSIWFVLIHKVFRIERAEADLILLHTN